MDSTAENFRKLPQIPTNGIKKGFSIDTLLSEARKDSVKTASPDSTNAPTPKATADPAVVLAKGATGAGAGAPVDPNQIAQAWTIPGGPVQEYSNFFRMAASNGLTPSTLWQAAALSPVLFNSGLPFTPQELAMQGKSLLKVCLKFVW